MSPGSLGTNSASPPAPKRSRLGVTLKRILRARITAGVAVVLPIWITFLLGKFIFELMRDMSLWIVVRYLASDFGKSVVNSWGVAPEVLAKEGLAALPAGPQWAIGLLCVFLTISFLYIVGVMTANFIGRWFVQGIESLFNRLPLIKTVYNACKQILASFTSESAREFQRVALDPFPSDEARSIGFITSISKDPKTGEELCSVFVATTPNPTTGYVFVLRRADVIELDWSIEDAISAVMSGGATMPANIPFSKTVLAGGRPLPLGSTSPAGV